MPYVYSHQALSGEGRAAKSLRTASVDDRSRWIHIQLNTFTNWSNEQLGRLGPPITDLGTDFSDGTRLIALVEALQKRTCTGKIYRNNPSEIQMLMNVQMALDALREDGVKLVNIGSHDIVEGNMKLILGLVWCLILRYQIASRTKIPPRKLMLAWIQAVLPELKISNFRTNWNDGKALSALLDYCQPGVFVHWRQLSSRDALNNCRRALQVAQAQFAIPQVVSPEDLSSPDLDELSCMTYISYFMKRDGPGYRATLNRVNQLIPEARVADFQRTWNDGLALCHLVHSVGGRIPGWPNLRFDPTQWMKNLHSGLMAAMELGLKPMITAKEMVEPDVEHLGVMVLAAELCGLPAVERSTRTHASPSFDSEPNIEETSCHIHQQVNLDLAFADGHEVSLSDLDAVVVGPDGTRVDEQTVQLLKTLTIRGAVVSLVPPMPGPYEASVAA
uniref:Calponin-homology (CH) domain-containing protein n=1 Tax=Plectus sambesii TaxID=2011161 RepID=A0A914VJE6_9BILA